MSDDNQRQAYSVSYPLPALPDSDGGVIKNVVAATTAKNYYPSLAEAQIANQRLRGTIKGEPGYTGSFSD